jgi:hypothetical protein
MSDDDVHPRVEEIKARGDQVSIHELSRWLLNNLSLDCDHVEDASALLSAFDITKKVES